MSRASALALLVLASGLAGCVEQAQPVAPATSLPVAAPAPTAGLLHLPDGVLAPGLSGPAPSVGGAYLTGFRGTEPTVAVTKSGAVFTDGFRASPSLCGQPQTCRSEPTVYRTRDHGQTWEDVGPGLPSGDALPPTTSDPIVYADPLTDRLFWLNQVETACATLFTSDDEGATWAAHPVACGTPGLVDHVTIVAAKPRKLPTLGYPDVVYMCANSVYQTGCATSLDGGATFGPLRMVFAGVDPASPQAFCGGIHSLPRSGPDGKVYVAKDQCGVAMVAVSDDDGLTWAQHAVSSDPAPWGNEVHVAVDAANHVYATFTDAKDGFVWLAASKDGGATWGKPVNVTAPGVTAADLPVITAGDEGKVALGYIGTTIPGGYHGKPEGNPGLAGDVLGQPDAPEWRNATWNAYIALVADALGDKPVIESLTANPPSDPVARGLCGHTRCHGMNDFTDATVDAQGRPWFAFIDTCTQKCRTDNSTLADRTLGFVGTLVSGQALRGDAPLPSLLPPPVIVG
jgi:hypothetical protein